MPRSLRHPVAPRPSASARSLHQGARRAAPDRRDVHGSGVATRRRDLRRGDDVRHQRQRVEDVHTFPRPSTRPASPTRSTRSTQGSASTSDCCPNSLTLSGHLGETVNVVVTNGYAAVQIDKTTSTPIGDARWTDHLHVAGHQHRWSDPQPGRRSMIACRAWWNWCQHRSPVEPGSVIWPRQLVRNCSAAP